MAFFKTFSTILNKANDVLQTWPSNVSSEVKTFDERNVKQVVKEANDFVVDLMKNDEFAFIHVPSKKIYFSSASKDRVLSVIDRLEPFQEISTIEKKQEVLQRLVQLAVAKETWRPIHLAAATGLLHFLEEATSYERGREKVFFTDVTEEGQSAIHVAAEHGQAAAMKLFLKYDCPLNKRDLRQRYPLHYAALHVSVLKEIVAHPQGKKSVIELANGLDDENMSAFHYALRDGGQEALALLLSLVPLKADLPVPLVFALQKIVFTERHSNCIESLARRVPGYLNALDSKNRSILHYPIPKEMMNALLYWNGPSSQVVNAQDTEGYTPLHVAVCDGQLGLVMTLISYGCNVNIATTYSKSALVFAIERGHIQIVKALLLFEADITEHVLEALKHSKKGEIVTAVRDHLAINNEKRALDPPNIDVEYYMQHELLQKLKAESNEKRVNLLSLDGGGIRGLVLLQILHEIQRRYDGNLLQHFKWIAGTSTGAILAVAFAKGRDVDYCRKMYFRFKDVVFCGKAPYKDSVLSGFLKAEFGENETLADISRETKTRVLVTTSRVDTCPSELVLLRSYGLPDKCNHRNFENAVVLPAWRAARCSSAAPVYFTSEEIDKKKYMDGGIMANNPTCDLLTDFQTTNSAIAMQKGVLIKLGCVLSVGTGQIPRTASKNVDVLPPSSVSNIINTVTSIWYLKDLFIEQLAAANGPHVDRSRAFTHALGGLFFRFCPILKSDIKLDEIADDTLVELMWQTKLYASENIRDVNLLVDYLKSLDAKK